MVGVLANHPNSSIQKRKLSEAKSVQSVAVKKVNTLLFRLRIHHRYSNHVDDFSYTAAQLKNVY